MKYYRIKGDFRAIRGISSYAQTKELAQKYVEIFVNKHPQAKCVIEEVETSMTKEELLAAKPFIFLVLY